MDVSLLAVLSAIAGFGTEGTTGTLVRGITGGGAQEKRFVGGSQLVAPLRARGRPLPRLTA